MQDWKDPSEFKGCGSFASESWQIFCCGQRDMRAVTDIKLRAYLRWLKSGRVQPAPRKATAVRKKGRRQQCAPARVRMLIVS